MLPCMYFVVIVFQGRALDNHIHVQNIFGSSDCFWTVGWGLGGAAEENEEGIYQIFLFILACWPGDKRNFGFQ